MTDDDLTAMEALAAKATAGPWGDDADFIAASRQFVPAAIAEIRRLQRAIHDSYAAGYAHAKEGVTNVE